jgi:hypothetical protein
LKLAISTIYAYDSREHGRPGFEISGWGEPDDRHFNHRTKKNASKIKGSMKIDQRGVDALGRIPQTLDRQGVACE